MLPEKRLAEVRRDDVGRVPIESTAVAVVPLGHRCRRVTCAVGDSMDRCTSLKGLRDPAVARRVAGDDFDDASGLGQASKDAVRLPCARSLNLAIGDH